jgi:HEPN domain-containing protein
MDAVVGDYVDRAATSIKQAEDCLGRGDCPTSVLRSAEAVEFALKAAIRLVGGAYDRKHDVSNALAKAFPDFPPWFKDKVPRFRLLSRIFTSLSLDAKYGDEMLGTPPKVLFSEREARAYLESASEVLNESLRLLREKGSA